MAKIAFIGTGFVADYYMTTLANHPELDLVGAWDQDGSRLRKFCDFYSVRERGSLEEVLSDNVDIIVNLTTPESHFPINRRALEAGKHVYCEKPLAMTVEDAETLVSLAEEKGLSVCGAPANALSDAFHLAREQMEMGRIGRPRLVYAEMEDGPVFRANWSEWHSRSGAPWPGLHEFEVGCSLEHAGYALSWLIGLFGPVERVSAFSALTFPDKGPGTEHLQMAPDFSVGCLTFRSGVVARLTCGLAAPRDRSMTILGETGTLVIRDLWDNRSPLNLAANDERTLAQKVASKIENRLGRALPFRLHGGKRVAYARQTRAAALPSYPSQIDFARGIKAQAEAIATGTKPFFSGRTALHLTEVALALHAGLRDHEVRNTFDTMP
ncbi:gfo/Idh/MocA family oxidoreductase [Mesorhizobium sp. NBSH29]|uniref:Gfo/Idh/MocA family protein n=1 Tax=Mesorhizobium sp. NBSH29 TaxID=2654249 RepID=UPI001896957D|nr:Gfo/Idh/MocA family oxidoreductase [Mesorhizobium sp. NBSH29]QPC86691.1 gfo/Idh/MocA family oxidoreductase [Mesorhizobium sp. NBSH29]